MPTEPNPTPVTIFPHQANVPAPGMTLTVQIQSDGTDPDADLDGTLQEIVDYLQAWPGRLPGGNATGQKYQSLLYTVTATNPDPVPDPLPEPEMP